MHYAYVGHNGMTYSKKKAATVNYNVLLDSELKPYRLKTDLADKITISKS